MLDESHVLRDDGVVHLYSDDFVVMKDVKQEYINQGSDCERVLILIEDATDTDGCKSDRNPPSQRSLLGITFKH